MNTNRVVKTVGGEPYEFEQLGQYIVRAVGVCGGRPTVKYTRIEMSHLLDRIAQGDSITDIVGDYRGACPVRPLQKPSKSLIAFLRHHSRP